jgi:hypothetical protein
MKTCHFAGDLELYAFLLEAEVLGITGQLLTVTCCRLPTNLKYAEKVEEDGVMSVCGPLLSVRTHACCFPLFFRDPTEKQATNIHVVRNFSMANTNSTYSTGPNHPVITTSLEAPRSTMASQKWRPTLLFTKNTLHYAWFGLRLQIQITPSHALSSAKFPFQGLVPAELINNSAYFSSLTFLCRPSGCLIRKIHIQGTCGIPPFFSK